jgi:hypothetical protein
MEPHQRRPDTPRFAQGQGQMLDPVQQRLIDVGVEIPVAGGEAGRGYPAAQDLVTPAMGDAQRVQSYSRLRVAPRATPCIQFSNQVKSPGIARLDGVGIPFVIVIIHPIRRCRRC